ncbi:class I SAM-dependent RNA methyltransferase [Aeromicrobium sp. CTD01-1L150]|uniref:class I SAM-dependent RNA methyltransferase n=1 Tax=Aeromicrobium sp. CTD01-1L150 TaxID=3341830 RepID=UPI0035C00A36
MVGEALPVVEVGPIAHGGHCVARLDGQVVFVRHTLPGETVRIRITEDAGRFLRADAVDVVGSAPGRVEPPCELAGTCGGCDFQHVSPERQRELLTDVVREQLQRLAGVTWDGHVEAVAPDLGWRTRMSWAVDDEGRPGLRRHRSHDVVPVQTCPIAHPDLPDVLSHRWQDELVQTVISSTGEQLVACDGPVPDGLSIQNVVDAVGQRRTGRPSVVERVGPHDFRVSGTGFWQIHPRAAATLVDAVLAAAAVRRGDTVADLYAGVGLFTAFLADAVGEQGTVVSVEADPGGARDARRNLHDRHHVRLVHDTTERALRRGAVPAADVVVLDPPRTGAKRAAKDLAALGARTIVYVACDPAALARDVASFERLGYRLQGVRGFALFPMTHHVECVATLTQP